MVMNTCLRLSPSGVPSVHGLPNTGCSKLSCSTYLCCRKLITNATTSKTRITVYFSDKSHVKHLILVQQNYNLFVVALCCMHCGFYRVKIVPAVLCTV